MIYGLQVLAKIKSRERLFEYLGRKVSYIDFGRYESDALFFFIKKYGTFYRSGGIIIATGELPKASTCMGENDSKADAIIREVFGATSLEVSQGKKVKKQVHDSGGVGLYMSEDKVSEQIKSLIVPDFISGTGEGKVLHRYVGERDVYMVMDVPEGTECFSELRVKLNFGMLLTE